MDLQDRSADMEIQTTSRDELIREITELRSRLGLSMDEHWNDFLSRSSTEEMNDILVGLRELATVFALLAGVALD